MKHTIVAALIVGIFALSPTPTYACFCLVPDVPDSFARASDVFVGVITEIYEPNKSREKGALSDRFFTIKFRVERVFKGRFTHEISVLADQGRLGCFSFPTVFKGEEYLVYGEPVGSEGKANGVVFINGCNRAGLINEQLKQPAYGLEFRDWFGRNIRTEDLEELEEITTTAFKFEFNRSLSKPTARSRLNLWRRRVNFALQ